jgi:hypothetical protein
MELQEQQPNNALIENTFFAKFVWYLVVYVSDPSGIF